ncbi:nucleotidyltransferase family protein [Aliiglaciecola sp. 3_MG-2023]|uniref:nucleotidyltransferase family protein n=1 Tax=Aliiglaciecola sp. 3_MG-2023 TaxID=3062644 RepID=UPI0026E41F8D|nr:nucleotidyltransferase family protein [Aliiglaciecola sp. 3_MG-2023]MDO6692467.1 nucleotidyltransferase family protein [Aliiglaciecola sp. 3_MG-2023]
MNIVSLILAAGEAKRFGSLKQLAVINGQSMLNTAITQHRLAGIDKIVVVLGAKANRIQQQIDPLVDVVLAPNWQLGMGESIRVGVDFIKHRRYPKTSNILIGLGDQVAVKSAQILKLCNAVKSNSTSIVAADYGDNIGVPACFPAHTFNDLLNLNSTNANLQKGAKTILSAYRQNVVTVNMPEAQLDIDTTEDLRRWCNFSSQ